MAGKDWRSYCSEIGTALERMQATMNGGRGLDADAAFALLLEKTLSCKAQGRELFFCGNGASATMASHTAADIAKNGGLRARSLTEPALLTAIANDISFEEVFSLPVTRNMMEGDMLVAISSSGKSPNILAAARAARQAGGYVVTLSGFAEDNPLRALGVLNFYIPAPSYGVVESCHATLLHHWVDMAVFSHARGK